MLMLLESGEWRTTSLYNLQSLLQATNKIDYDYFSNRFFICDFRLYTVYCFALKMTFAECSIESASEKKCQLTKSEA